MKAFTASYIIFPHILHYLDNVIISIVMIFESPQTFLLQLIEQLLRSWSIK